MGVHVVLSRGPGEGHFLEALDVGGNMCVVVLVSVVSLLISYESICMKATSFSSCTPCSGAT